MLDLSTTECKKKIIQKLLSVFEKIKNRRLIFSAMVGFMGNSKNEV